MAKRKLDFSEAMGLFTSGASGARGASGAGSEGDPPPESVTALAERIKVALDDRFRAVRVRGEISNFTARNHWYFSIKDESAVLSCAMWQSAVARHLAAQTWTPKDGDAVVLTGAVSFYAPQGRTQIYVTGLARVGAGSLQERYERLCADLRGKGHFDESRKRPLPSFPRRIAIVTSATGAALQDCLRTAANRLPAVGIVVVDVRVQGEGAAREIGRAVRALDAAAARLGIDAIVVTRGGGSIEDLWAFNEPEVYEAILARRSVPIVAAIGHESDTTIAELVADRRASTPTQAITFLVPDRADLTEDLAQLADRLGGVLRRGIRERRGLLEALAKRPVLRSPAAALVAFRRALDDARGALRNAMDRRVAEDRRQLARAEVVLVGGREAGRLRTARQGLLQQQRRLERTMLESLRRRRDRVDAGGRQLEAVGPMQVLARGYSYTVDASGRIVRRVADAPPGTRLRTTVADGSFESTVDRPDPRADSRR